MKVLVTGASGFVGRALCDELLGCGHAVGAALRSRAPESWQGIDTFVVGSIDATTDWRAAMDGRDVVVHLAARVHVMHDDATDPLAEFSAVNTEGTLNLAKQAAASGIRRFVFISSIKVNGEYTKCGAPFFADDVPAPIDAYGISKYKAEFGLQRLAEKTGMEVVIIRSPLVYGPGVKANFLSMMSWLKRGVPLPFGAVHNLRSLVALDNLVDLIAACLEHPAAANQVFLVSDGEDLSTKELLQRMGMALGLRTWLIPVPAFLLEACALLLGKRAFAQRLLGSLQVDISKTRTLLGWTPPMSVDEGLKKTAEYWLATHRGA